MTDIVSKSQRSRNMGLIKSQNTKPEIVVRKTLYKLGYRYRLQVKDLPGKPDIVIRRLKTAIFVNGCFWHQHENCNRASIPKSNVNYWIKKLDGNKQRDINSYRSLEELGWKIVIIWECETKDVEKLKNLVKERIND